jgi:hypothetical protein
VVEKNKRTLGVNAEAQPFISNLPKSPEHYILFCASSALLNNLSIFATDFVPSKKTIPLANR